MSPDSIASTHFVTAPRRVGSAQRSVLFLKLIAVLAVFAIGLIAAIYPGVGADYPSYSQYFDPLLPSVDFREPGFSFIRWLLVDVFGSPPNLVLSTIKIISTVAICVFIMRLPRESGLLFAMVYLFMFSLEQSFSTIRSLFSCAVICLTLLITNSLTRSHSIVISTIVGGTVHFTSLLGTIVLARSFFRLSATLLSVAALSLLVVFTDYLGSDLGAASDFIRGEISSAAFYLFSLVVLLLIFKPSEPIWYVLISLIFLVPVFIPLGVRFGLALLPALCLYHRVTVRPNFMVWVLIFGLLAVLRMAKYLALDYENHDNAILSIFGFR